MDDQLVPASAQDDIIVPHNADKDSKYRLGKFATWLATEGSAWHAVDLAVYCDHLLGAGYSPSIAVSAVNFATLGKL